MDEKFENIEQAVVRFLQANPELAKQCAEILKLPSIGAAGRATQMVQEAMDTAHWIHSGDMNTRGFIDIVSRAVNEVCPYEVDWNNHDTQLN